MPLPFVTLHVSSFLTKRLGIVGGNMCWLHVLAEFPGIVAVTCVFYSVIVLGTIEVLAAFPNRHVYQTRHRR
jgi:hypothetical protein